MTGYVLTDKKYALERRTKIFKLDQINIPLLYWQIFSMAMQEGLDLQDQLTGYPSASSQSLLQTVGQP
jgi:hypothetical protein